MAHDDERAKDGLSWKDEIEDPPWVAGDLEHCYCGRPTRRGWMHHNNGDTDCYEIEEDNVTMSNEFEDEKIAAGYIKASSQAYHMGGKSMTDPQKVLKVAQAPAVTVVKAHHDQSAIVLEITNVPNEQAYRIVTEVLPYVVQLYMDKSRDYGGNVMAMLKLGPKASFVDLWRKVGKLKRALWDGEPMRGEQTDEILMDCIGHILITLDELRTNG